jgi:hypothetical protein
MLSLGYLHSGKCPQYHIFLQHLFLSISINFTHSDKMRLVYLQQLMQLPNLVHLDQSFIRDINNKYGLGGVAKDIPTSTH